MDVSSFYTNISDANGLRASGTELPQNNLIDTFMHLTKFILKHSYTSFCNCFYLQINGTAVGTRMAPQHANIFMADHKGKTLAQTLYQPVLHLRYINDIFMIWTHGEETLQSFHEKLNHEDL